jgi:Flp pilus assembly pilin Flp
MGQRLFQLWRDEDGQDLIEYTLLITFIAIACLAFVGAGRPAVNGIWSTSNSQLVTANTTAGS